MHEECISVRVDFDGDLSEKFLHVKKLLGFKTNTAVLIHLVNEAFNRQYNRGLSKEKEA